MELQDRTIKVVNAIDLIVQRCVNQNWKCPSGGSALLRLQAGLDILPRVYSLPEVSSERIVDYVVYQLYRGKTAIADGRWSLDWMFSNNAIEKFKAQFFTEDGKSGVTFYINKWLKEHGLTRTALCGVLEPKKDNVLRRMVYMPAEEPIKKRFLGTDDAVAMCIQSTTGWSPFSETCKNCADASECEQLTNRKYPELFRFRKEAYEAEKSERANG